MPMEKGESIIRKTLRIEKSIEKNTRHAIYHHNVDDFHAYVRMLIRRDLKSLVKKGIIEDGDF